MNDSYWERLRALRAGVRAFRRQHTRERVGRAYHMWYYDSGLWQQTKWFGIPIQKLPFDLWNYQEILYELRPGLLIEFGSCYGGSALYFSHLLRSLGQPYCVLSVDVEPNRIAERARQDPNIVFFHSSSSDPKVAEVITEQRANLPGPVFAILDSDHTKQHVLAEMELLRPLLKSGDYMVVEDSNINGHPVAFGWGEGPFEAIEEYMHRHPDDYSHDREREYRFAATFAPNGYLIRR